MGDELARSSELCVVSLQHWTKSGEVAQRRGGHVMHVQVRGREGRESRDDVCYAAGARSEGMTMCGYGRDTGYLHTTRDRDHASSSESNARLGRVHVLSIENGPIGPSRRVQIDDASLLK